MRALFAKKVPVFLLLVLIPLLVFPQNDRIRLGPYAGYYSPTDESFNLYYQPKDIIFGLKTGFRIWKGLSVYGYFYQYELVSKTTVTEEISRFKMLPVSICLRYEYRYRFLRPFIGAGMTMVFFSETNAIEPEGLEDSTTGWNVNLGVGFQISRHFVIEASVMKSEAFYENVIDADSGWVETINLGALQAGVAFIVMLF